MKKIRGLLVIAAAAYSVSLIAMSAPTFAQDGDPISPGPTPGPSPTPTTLD